MAVGAVGGTQKPCSWLVIVSDDYRARGSLPNDWDKRESINLQRLMRRFKVRKQKPYAATGAMENSTTAAVVFGRLLGTFLGNS